MNRRDFSQKMLQKCINTPNFPWFLPSLSYNSPHSQSLSHSYSPSPGPGPLAASVCYPVSSDVLTALFGAVITRCSMSGAETGSGKVSVSIGVLIASTLQDFQTIYSTKGSHIISELGEPFLGPWFFGLIWLNNRWISFSSFRSENTKKKWNCFTTI